VSGRGFVISRAGEDAFFISISLFLSSVSPPTEFFPRCYPDGLHGGPVFHPFYVPFFVISVNRVRFRTEAKNGKVQPAGTGTSRCADISRVTRSLADAHRDLCDFNVDRSTFNDNRVPARKSQKNEALRDRQALVRSSIRSFVRE